MSRLTPGQALSTSARVNSLSNPSIVDSMNSVFAPRPNPPNTRRWSWEYSLCSFQTAEMCSTVVLATRASIIRPVRTLHDIHVVRAATNHPAARRASRGNSRTQCPRDAYSSWKKYCHRNSPLFSRHHVCHFCWFSPKSWPVLCLISVIDASAWLALCLTRGLESFRSSMNDSTAVF